MLLWAVKSQRDKGTILEEISILLLSGSALGSFRKSPFFLPRLCSILHKMKEKDWRCLLNGEAVVMSTSDVYKVPGVSALQKGGIGTSLSLVLQLALQW